MKLQRARPAQFAANPMGRFVIGPGYLLWCATPHLGGSALWSGPLREEQIHETLRLFDRRHDAMSAPIDLITDGRSVAEIDPAWYGLVSNYFVTRWATHAGRIRRHAVIAPSGLVGAVMAGTYLREDSEHKIRVFDQAEPAYAWVGAQELFAQLEALLIEATEISPLMRDLRGHLEQQLCDATLESAARATGVSVRSLQRQLGRLGTTFRGELDHARVRAAKVLLRDSDAKLDAIAARVGCASGSHLNTVFRRVTGQPPGRHRS